MKKSVKVLLAVIIVLLILFIGLYMAVGAAEKTLPSETIYPEGNLSDSIFDSQNNGYIKNESLPLSYAFADIPYYVDVPNDQGVIVGDGNFYSFGDGNYYMYAARFDKRIDPDGNKTMSDNISEAVMLTCRKELSTLQNMASDKGYINGFAADYFADILRVSDGKVVESVCMTGYTLDVPEDENYGITIAIISNTQSTQHMQQCKSVLDIVAYTCRYSPDLAQEMLEAEERELRLAKEEAERVAKEEERQKAEEDAAAQEALDRQQEELIVSIAEDYTSLVVYFNYSNIDKDVDAVLYNEDRSLSYYAVSNSNGVAIFNVGNAQAGDWILEVTGNYGRGNVQLADSASVEFGVTSNAGVEEAEEYYEEDDSIQTQGSVDTEEDINTEEGELE